MGINRGNQVCANLCALSLIKQPPTQRERAILYIDGPILLYCGNVTTKYVVPYDRNQRSICIVQRKLWKIRHEVSQYYQIDQIRIYFDGNAPKEKAFVQLQRASRRSNYDLVAIKELFIRSMGNFKDYISFIQLENGESEMEIYKQRDVTKKSIVYTKDTDFFTIAYGHDAPDDVIFCQEKEKKLNFYDMRRFRYKSLSKYGFHLLMALLGTDYTDNRLSPTQTQYVLNYFSSLDTDENTFNDEYTIDGVTNSIKIICDLLNGSQQVRNIKPCRDYSLIMEIQYVDSILRYLKYIKHGMVGDY